MTPVERRRLVDRYLGGKNGYLAGFDNVATLSEFFIDCNLDVNPRDIQQETNRKRFEIILEGASPIEQAAIIRRALAKHPPEPERWPARTQDLYDELLDVAARLLGAVPVASPELVYTSDVVKRSIADVENLIKSSGAPSCVDRVHTILHGHLQYLCEQEKITFNDKATINGLFGLLRQKHPAFANASHREQDIGTIFKALGMIMDALGPLRNNASPAHPNVLLEAAEAMLVVNAARSIVTYLDAKIVASV
jgi:hypothetical protein